MANNIKTTKPTYKKVIKIVLLIPLVLIGLLILYVVGVYATEPFFDNLEHDRFKKLDVEMQSIYKDLKTASNGADDWKYAAVCSAEYTGPWLTGDYYCVTSISTQKNITTVKEINDLQAKYYPIINNNPTLTTKTELDPEFPDDFGKRFVVSSAEKNYIEKKSKIECNYSIMLYQSVMDENLTTDAYGSAINNGVAESVISLRCSEIANQAWYKVVKTTDSLIPNSQE